MYLPRVLLPRVLQQRAIRMKPLSNADVLFLGSTRQRFLRTGGGCWTLGFRSLGWSVSVRGWGSCWPLEVGFAKEYVQGKIARPRDWCQLCMLVAGEDAGFKTPRVVDLQASAWAATPPRGHQHR